MTSFFKKLGKIKGSDVLNVATGGITGTVQKAAAGDYKGAVLNQVTMGIPGAAKAVNDATNGIGIQAGTQVNAVDGSNYVQTAKDYLNPIYDQYSQAGNTQITSNVDPAFRNYQLGLAQQLQAQASGQGPSIAQNQLQAATDRTLSQSLGNIRAATGANAGLSARTAALAGAQGLGSAANSSGTLRLQEQQAAQQQLAAVSAQGLQGDLTANGQGIQAQQATVSNKLAGLAGMQGVQQAKLGTEGQVLGYDQAAQMQTSQNKNGRINALGGAVINGLATGLA